jgi:hypothetical protein
MACPLASARRAWPVVWRALVAGVIVKLTFCHRQARRFGNQDGQCVITGV